MPNSWWRATNSSRGPLAIVVAKSGRSPRLNASATAALSLRYHSIFFPSFRTSLLVYHLLPLSPNIWPQGTRQQHVTEFLEKHERACPLEGGGLSTNARA